MKAYYLSEIEREDILKELSGVDTDMVIQVIQEWEKESAR